MFRRIDYLRDFGPYQDFCWSPEALPDFARFNLIYGWNYSGKTSLSRAFATIEGGTLPPQFAQSTFRFLTDAGTTLDARSLRPAPTVRVFNRDYVDRNFASESQADAIFIVGEDVIRIQQRIVAIERRSARLQQVAATARGEAAVLRSRREGRGTETAREVGRMIGDQRGYTRVRLEEDVTSVRNDPSAFRLTEDETELEAAFIKQAGDFRALIADFSRARAFVDAIAAAKEAIALNVVYAAIEELSGDVDLERWTLEGFQLHADRTSCAFCEGAIREDRRATLAAHFSETFSALARKLEVLEERLRGMPVEVRLPDPGLIVPGLRERAMHLGSATVEWISSTDSLRAEVLALLHAKRADPTTVLELRETPVIGELEQLIQEFDQIAQAQLGVVEDQGSRLVEAKRRIRLSAASAFSGELDLEALEKSVATLSARAERADRLHARCTQEIERLRSDASGAERGAERMNELLRVILADTALSGRPSQAGRFQFFRNGALAKNLSEGERTAVTFAHFLARLEEGHASLEDSIIFVDDPISSLDSRNIYAMFALVRLHLKKAKQLFVSTHNAEFFGYLRREWRERGKWRKHHNAYYTRRLVGSGGAHFCTIESLPKALADYSSEYEFVFAELVRFARSSEPALRDCYLAANLLRRFLEAYLGFKRPVPLSWEDKLDLLVEDEMRAAAVKKFCDDGSHLQARHRSLEHAGHASVAQAIVLEIIRSVEARDPEHYSSLLTACALEKEAEEVNP